MHDNLKNRKTAVITGASSGIGLCIAQAFDAAGYNVVVAARESRGALKTLSKEAIFVPCNVKRLKDVQALMDHAKKKTGRLDVLINCAGFSKWQPIEKIDEAFLSEMLDVNLKGAFWGCKAALKHMKKDGAIINIASLAGKRGSADNSAYCASKFGVVGLTQSLAKELGPRGIRVNAVCPVYVMTAGVIKALNEKTSPAKGKSVATYLKDFTLTQTALKRLPTTQEIATTCLFLASEQASAITGQSLNVDCGVLPQ